MKKSKYQKEIDTAIKMIKDYYEDALAIFREDDLDEETMIMSYADGIKDGLKILNNLDSIGEEEIFDFTEKLLQEE